MSAEALQPRGIFLTATTGSMPASLIMASTAESRDAKLAIGHSALAGLKGVEVTARLEVGVPPTLREHFGFADGISRPFIEGQGGEPLPGQGTPMKAGEFILGYENELGQLATGPGPEALWRNGTYIAIRKIYQDVAAFRRYLRECATDSAGQEMVAAKMMGRWRSGCPLALSPDADNPGIVADPRRNNDFAYFDDDRNGQRDTGRLSHPARESTRWTSRHHGIRTVASTAKARRRLWTHAAGRRHGG